jgi:superfamily II DNA or RNA helicase
MTNILYNRALIAWSTGTGKTRTAIELVKKSDAKACLVICPKGIKEKWKQEIAHWGLLIPTEVLSKEELKKRARLGILRVPEAIISDEHHNMLGTTSQLGKVMSRLAKHPQVKYFYGLTATPYRSSPWDIFVLCSHFGVTLNFKMFKSNFFYDAMFGQRKISIPKKNWKEMEKLKQYMAPFSHYANMEDCFDVPEQVDDYVYFDTDYEKSEDIPIVAFTHDHQEEAMCKEKLEYIKEVVENNDRVVIVCRYLDQIAYYKSVFKDAFVICGETVDREGIIKKVNSLEKVVVIVSSGCSEGYELSTFGIMIFASQSYSYVDYVQMKGRIHRANNLKKNLYIHLVCLGRDKQVLEAILEKRDFTLNLYG